MTVIDDFKARHKPPQLLARFGFQYTYTCRHREYIIHPGADKKKHKSSGNYDSQKEVYYCNYCPGIPVFKKGKGYSSFDLYILLKLGGDPENPEDVKRAVAELGKLSYGAKKK